MKNVNVKELEFSKTGMKVGVAKLIKSKERDNDFQSFQYFQSNMNQKLKQIKIQSF